MKPIVLLSVLTSALVAGFVGASLFAAYHVQRAAAATDTPAQVGAAPPAQHEPVERGSDPSAASDSETKAEVAVLRDQLAKLEIEVASLREELGQRGAPEELATDDGKHAPGELATVDRDAIVKVMAEERDKEQKKRDDDRKQREREAIDRLAERAAKDLGLAPKDQTRLGDFMVTASEKRDELFRTARDGGPEGFRTAFDDFRTWRDGELKKTFGDQLGQQLIDYQNKMRGDWGGGGGGPPGGWSGGNSGNNNNSQGSGGSFGRRNN